MRTEQEIKDKLIFVRHKIWQNGSDVDIWYKVKQYLDWVLSQSEVTNDT